MSCNAGSTELDYWCGTNKSAPAAQGSLRTNQQRYYGQAQADRKEAAAHHAARAPAPQEADGADRQADQRARAAPSGTAGGRTLEFKASSPVPQRALTPAFARLLAPAPLARSLTSIARSFTSGPAFGPQHGPVLLVGIFVMVGANKSKFKPSIQAIKECYYSKFRGKGGEAPEEPVA